LEGLDHRIHGSADSLDPLIERDGDMIWRIGGLYLDLYDKRFILQKKGALGKINP